MNWRYTIELNPVLTKMSKKHDLSNFEDTCPDEVKEEILKEIEKATPLHRFKARIKKAKSIASLNRILESVFDEADRSAVWCGFY